MTEGTNSCSGCPFNLLPLRPCHAPLALHPLMPNSLLSSESKLVSIRKDLLEQVQNECRSRGQQLITELTDFTKAFQTIKSDIHTLTWCSQKVGSPHSPFPAYPGPSRSHAQHTPFKSQLSSRQSLMLLNCAHMCGLPLPVLILLTWPSISS